MASGACTPPAPPSIFVVVVDTLRADHLGRPDIPTPGFDSLRRDAIEYPHAWSHVPLTLPSHASLFTGLLPHQNGVRDNLGYRLQERHLTLAEALRAQGYATGAAVSAIVLARGTGIEQGFDFYDDQMDASVPGVAPGDLQREGGRTLDRLLAWLDGVPRERPAFGFLHLYEPHHPYTPPPFAATAPSPYAGEVMAADALLVRFVSELRRRQRYEPALLVVTSDHGEGLGDHGEQEHGIFLYREALQVPLFVKLPGGARAGTADARPVGLIDLHPTLRAASGHPGGPPGSISLLDAPPAQRRVLLAETLYPRLHLGWADLASAVDAEWHYVEAPRPELFRLESDPAERADVWAQQRPDAARLARVLAKSGRAFQAPAEADPERAERLAALGYLSGGAAESAGPLPDPKDRVGVIGDLGRAQGLAAAGDLAGALALLDRLRGDNPGMLVLYNREAQMLLRAGRTAEALALIDAGVRHAPAGSGSFLLVAADLHLRAGSLETAARHATAAHSVGEPLSDLMLARIHLAAGRLDEAFAAGLRVAENSPAPAVARLLLAHVELRRNRGPAALEQLELARTARAQSRLPALPTEQQTRGQALLASGRPAEAAQAFADEVASFPGNLDAWTQLAFTRAGMQGAPAARPTLEAMLRANPAAAAQVQQLEQKLGLR